jgi:hypothetical protein
MLNNLKFKETSLNRSASVDMKFFLKLQAAAASAASTHFDESVIIKNDLKDVHLENENHMEKTNTNANASAFKPYNKFNSVKYNSSSINVNSSSGNSSRSNLESSQTLVTKNLSN